jgi:hypothetical protein
LLSLVFRLENRPVEEDRCERTSSCPPSRVLPKHLHLEGHTSVVKLRRRRLRKAQVKGKVESCAVDRQVKISRMRGGTQNSPSPIDSSHATEQSNVKMKLNST